MDPGMDISMDPGMDPGTWTRLRAASHPSRSRTRRLQLLNWLSSVNLKVSPSSMLETHIGRWHTIVNFPVSHSRVFRPLARHPKSPHTPQDNHEFRMQLNHDFVFRHRYGVYCRLSTMLTNIENINELRSNSQSIKLQKKIPNISLNRIVSPSPQV